jgi:1-deoxy-D-xylulose-5-phosphate reductoisomerase
VAVTTVQGISLLGSTGSIGKNTLDVISRHPDRYRVHALSANTSVDTMLAQCETWRPRFAVMQDADAASRLEQVLNSRALDTVVLHGNAALEQIASDGDVQIVVAAIVGAAGLLPTLAAAGSGKRLLLANKEALVMSGQLLMDAAARSGALVMPVDSEHNAIFQSLPVTGPLTEKPAVSRAGVTKILLTASGGPFRESTLEELRVVTPQQALKHPNWSMGPKISIDSATLMNKGLEVIEACHLFSIDVDDIEVLVHPESVVHSMVSYRDGSVLAQLGLPDMRTPIAHALAWPERIDAGVEALDLTTIAGLHFEAPDLERFPCLRLAFAAQRQGGTAPTVLNAANEVAVAAFLSGSVAFLQLPEIVEYTLLQAKISPADDLATIIDADTGARQLAHTHIHSLHL